MAPSFKGRTLAFQAGYREFNSPRGYYVAHVVIVSYYFSWA